MTPDPNPWDHRNPNPGPDPMKEPTNLRRQVRFLTRGLLIIVASTAIGAAFPPIGHAAHVLSFFVIGWLLAGLLWGSKR